MKYFKTLVISNILLCSMSFSQTINYEVLEDNTRFSDIAIRPNAMVEVGSGTSGFGMGLGIDMEYRKPNIPIDLRFNYFHNIFGNHIALAENFVGDKKPTRGLEIGAEYPLITKTKKKKVPVILDSKLIGSTSTTETYDITYLSVDGRIEKQLMVRSGFYHHRNNFSSPSIDGFKLVGNTGPGDAIEGTIGFSGLYSGIALLSRRFAKIKTEEYGISTGGMHMQLYADLLFATSDNVYPFIDETGQFFDRVEGKSYDLIAEEKAVIPVTKSGFRLGWLWNSTETKWYFKFEAGKRPAIEGSSLFFFGAFGIGINKG